jgi:hypothetical protein
MKLHAWILLAIAAAVVVCIVRGHMVEKYAGCLQLTRDVPGYFTGAECCDQSVDYIADALHTATNYPMCKDICDGLNEGENDTACSLLCDYQCGNKFGCEMLLRDGTKSCRDACKTRQCINTSNCESVCKKLRSSA